MNGYHCIKMNQAYQQLVITTWTWNKKWSK